MQQISVIAAGYDEDTGTLHILFDDFTDRCVDVERFESRLKTNMQTRSRLTWLLENDIFSYVRLMLGGAMQEYLDLYAKEKKSMYEDVLESYLLTETPGIARMMAREFIMYSDVS